MPLSDKHNSHFWAKQFSAFFRVWETFIRYFLQCLSIEDMFAIRDDYITIENVYLCVRHFLLHYKELATINIYLLKLAFKCKGVISSKTCIFFFAGNRIFFLFSGSYPKPIGPSCLSLSGFRMYLAYLNNMYFSFAPNNNILLYKIVTNS